MAEAPPVREQLTMFGPLVDKLVVLVKVSEQAFSHQRSQFLVQLMEQQEPLCREIGSAVEKVNEQMAAKPEGEREPYRRLYSILSHLQCIAAVFGRLEETLRKQTRDGILFSDKAISQTNQLFHQQEGVLRFLAEAIRSRGEEARCRVIEECRKMGQSCLQFATDHENRLVEGLCLPPAAPLFLAILDQMQTIVHHESEIANLLGNEF